MVFRYLGDAESDKSYCQSQILVYDLPISIFQNGRHEPEVILIIIKTVSIMRVYSNYGLLSSMKLVFKLNLESSPVELGYFNMVGIILY